MAFLFIILVEILMTPFIAYSVYYVSKFYERLKTREIGILVFFLAMMSGMLNSITYFLIAPNGFINQVTAINISMFEMSVFLSYLLVSSFNGNMKHMTRSHGRWLAVLVGWNEVSMAFLLYILAYGFGTGNVYVELFNMIGFSVTNYLFVIPMVVEMATVLFLVQHTYFRRKLSVSIILMQLADPAILGPSQYILPGSIIFTAVMLFTIYYVFSYVNSNRDSLEHGWNKQVLYFAIIIFLSAMGLVEPVLVNSYFGIQWIIFSFSMIFSMIFYFSMAFRVFQEDSESTGNSLSLPCP